MTHQLDLMPANLVDAAVLERIGERLPKAREVRSPRLRLARAICEGEVITDDPIPFGDGEPVFPSDRVPAYPNVNPMQRRRLQRIRDAVVVAPVLPVADATGEQTFHVEPHNSQPEASQ